jgi:hypothetical protein
MCPELILSELLVDMLDFKLLHLLGVYREINLVSIFRSSKGIRLDSLIVCSELGRFK